LDIYHKILKKPITSIHNRQLRIEVLLLSGVTGVWEGLSAILLKNITYYTHQRVRRGSDFEKGYYACLALPLTGLSPTVLFTNYVVRDKLSHGVSIAPHAVSKHFGGLPSHNPYSLLAIMLRSQ